MIEELIARVFYTRNAAHFFHWQSQSYSEHMTLGAFYDDIIEQLDAIVEAYQGEYSLVGGIPVPAVSEAKNILDHLVAENKWIADNEEKISQGNKALCNLIQSLNNTYQGAIYKLKNLK